MSDQDRRRTAEGLTKVDVSALLAECPVPERPESAWEDQAFAIQSRIAKLVETDESDQDLLEAPLGRLEGEPSSGAGGVESTIGESPMSSEPPKVPEKRLSLAEMARQSQRTARASQTPAPPSATGASSPPGAAQSSFVPEPDREDSGVLNLPKLHAQASIPPAAARLSAAPPASHVSVAPPPQAPLAQIAAAPAAPAAKRSRTGIVIGGAIALLGVAAAAAVMLKGGALDNANAPGAASDQAALTAGAVAQPAPPAASVAQGPSPTAPTTAAAVGNDPAPAATEAKAPAAPAAAADDVVAVAGKGKGTGHAVAARLGGKAGKAETAAAAPAPAAPAAAPAGGEPSGLKGAMAKAAGDPVRGSMDSPPAPAAGGAAGGNSNVPEVPSQGAIQGAIGSHMGSAKACVRGQDTASRVSLTFGSDGKVKSVSVSGTAVGTPAEGCLKSTFSKASVGPFSRASFPVSFTVRP